MTLWFGEQWPSAEHPAPVCEDLALRQPVPVGELCLQCVEPIGPDDAGQIQPYLKFGATTATLAPIHKECQLRAVTGNVKHLRGECRFVGDCNRHAGTYREQALEVWAYFNEPGPDGRSEAQREGVT